MKPTHYQVLATRLPGSLRDVPLDLQRTCRPPAPFRSLTWARPGCRRSKTFRSLKYAMQALDACNRHPLLVAEIHAYIEMEVEQ